MKIKSLLLTFLLLPLLCFPATISRYFPLLMSGSGFPAGMTFLANYNDGLLDADRSGGSPTATFTASRGASNPATFIDSSGVIQLTTTSNVGRFTHGYYDTSGFNLFSQSGVMIEGASTNFLKHSIFDTDGGGGVATDWASDNTVIDGSATTTLISEDLINISGSQAQTFSYTGVVGDVNTEYLFSQVLTGVVSQNDTITVSTWIKGTSSGVTVKLQLRFFDSGFGNASEDISSDIASSISSTEWRRFTHTFKYVGTTANANKALPDIAVDGIDDGDTFSLQTTAFQYEKFPFVTSFIPTTADPLTRNAETLKYVISGNRTAAVESCVVKFALEFEDSIVGSKFIFDTDDVRRTLRYTSNDKTFTMYANKDNGSCVVNSLVNEEWTANTEFTLGYNMQSGTIPYIAGYYDGVADGINETSDDFDLPAWGTYFHVGSTTGGGQQLFGTLFSIGFFDRVLSAAEHLSLHNKE